MNMMDMIIKDIKCVVYDVKSLALLIMPIIIMSILGISLQGVFGEEADSGVAMSKIGVVKAYDKENELMKVQGKIDLDEYEKSDIEGMDFEKSFFELLDNDELQEFVTYEVLEMDEAEIQLNQGEIDAIVILPKNFIFNGYMALTGSRLVSEIEYVTSSENKFIADIVGNIIDSYKDMVNNIYATQLTTLSLLIGNVPEGADVSIDDILTSNTPEDAMIEFSSKSTNRKDSINSFQYYSAAIMCMFLLYSASIGGRALLDERNDRTIPRIVVSGNGIIKIVFSNFIRVMLLVLIQSIIMIGFSSLVLGVDWGNITTIVVGMLLSAIAVGSLGMMISVITLIANNRRVAELFEFVIIYVMALIGGSFIPVETLPSIVRSLDFLSLNGQVLKIYINGMYNLSLAKSGHQIMILIAFSMFFIGTSIVLIARKGRELAC